MAVYVRLLGVFRRILGKGKISIELEGPIIIGEVIQKIVESSTCEFNRLLIDSELNDPRPNALILINGREISALEGLKTKVKEDDEIVLIPISHGG